MTLLEMGLLFLVIFVSCKKDSVRLDYPASYHRTKITGTGIRVFAKSGEIKDQSIVSRFTQYDSFDMANARFNLDTFRIVDQSNAVVIELYSATKFTYSNKGKGINFISTDTFRYSSDGEVFTRTLPYQIGLYKPIVYNEYIVSSTGGNYVFGYAGRKEYNLQVEEDHLTAPALIYMQHKKVVTFIRTNIQNKLDVNFYKWIPDGDTIAVQEYNVLYEK